MSAPRASQSDVCARESRVAMSASRAPQSDVCAREQGTSKKVKQIQIDVKGLTLFSCLPAAGCSFPPHRGGIKGGAWIRGDLQQSKR